jgi:hypoxanthine phosphoribosyltransferase
MAAQIEKTATAPTALLSRRRVPPPWREEISRILVSEVTLRRRVRQLAKAIEQDYQSRDLVIVSLLNGTVVFLADLIRTITLPLHLDFIGVSSYGSSTESKKIVFTKDLKLDVKGRDVLIVDDILDTGKTLDAVLKILKKLRPRSTKVCVLLNKEARREKPIRADYVGFYIPNLFVVGYGLDYAEKYRNLPFIGVVENHFAS